jgi:hypothetical protein
MKWSRSLISEAIVRTCAVLFSSWLFWAYLAPYVGRLKGGQLLLTVPILLLILLFFLFVLPLLVRPKIQVFADKTNVIINSPWFTHCGNVSFRLDDVTWMGWKKGVEFEDIFVVELKTGNKIVLTKLPGFPVASFDSWIRMHAGGGVNVG